MLIGIICSIFNYQALGTHLHKNSAYRQEVNTFVTPFTHGLLIKMSSLITKWNNEEQTITSNTAKGDYYLLTILIGASKP